MISFSLKGIPEMKAKIQNAGKTLPEEAGKALYQEMKIELVEVIKRTPKDTGALRESEKLLGPIKEGNSIVVMIVAGGPEAPYAMIVHEDLEAFHKVGQAKYLESVLLESRPYIGARVAKRLNIATMVG